MIVAHRQRTPRRFSIVGIAGELLITAGVFIFLFLGWQLWLNDIIVGDAQQRQAMAFAHTLDSAGGPSPTHPGVSPEPLPTGSAAAAAVVPVLAAVPAHAKKFANIYIPRFGADYVRTIAEGVDAGDVLKTGVGHYPTTQLPGEIGNFAVAAHRTTWGKPFNLIAELRVGDKIFVQTADGWYTYIYRNTEYVRPTGVEVLLPAPGSQGVTPTDRIMTMTSCNPMLSAAERIVAYSVFDSFQVAPPAGVAALVQAAL